MVLLRTIAICTGTSSNTILDYNLESFGVCMIKLLELPPEKKLTPQPPPEKSRTSHEKP